MRLKKILEELEMNEARGRYEVLEYKDIYVVINKPSYKLIRLEYETENYETRDMIYLSRRDMENSQSPSDMMDQRGIYEISVREFLLTYKNMYEGYKDELERKGIIERMGEREFNRWSSGKDYDMYDREGNRLKSFEEFVRDIRSIRDTDPFKAEKIGDKIEDYFNVRYIMNIPIDDLEVYGKQSEDNYKKLQYLYKSMENVVLPSEDEIEFWEELAVRLRFPDNVEYNTEL